MEPAKNKKPRPKPGFLVWLFWLNYGGVQNFKIVRSPVDSSTISTSDPVAYLLSES